MSSSCTNYEEALDSFYQRRGKRIADFALALFGLVLLGIPMLAVGLLVLVVDGAPILFRQQRVGRHGCLFMICKYRTMRNRAQEGTTVTVAGDQRVSLLGRLLRACKIDELPQLINVLKGEMSFVGPRPDVPGYADRLTGGDRLVLAIRPGITGPATLAFRNEEDLLAGVPDPSKYNDQVIFPEKVRLIVEYARTMTLAKDVALILKTVF
jgi:lipopolysaccharide/colanic/teichoic acid biosynthesis glycosyltransferase